VEYHIYKYVTDAMPRLDTDVHKTEDYI